MPKACKFAFSVSLTNILIFFDFCTILKMILILVTILVAFTCLFYARSFYWLSSTCQFYPQSFYAPSAFQFYLLHSAFDYVASALSTSILASYSALLLHCLHSLIDPRRAKGATGRMGQLIVYTNPKILVMFECLKYSTHCSKV